MNIRQAVELTKGLAKSYRAVLAVSDALDKIDNLEIREKKLFASIEKLKDQRSEAQTLLDATNYDLQEAASARNKAIRDADAIISKADETYAKLVSDSEKVAANIIQEAETKQEAIANKVSRDFEEHDSRMKRFNLSEDIAQAKLDAIQEEIDALKKRLG